MLGRKFHAMAQWRKADILFMAPWRALRENALSRPV